LQAPYAAFAPNQPLAARSNYGELAQRAASDKLSEKELAAFMPNQFGAFEQLKIMGTLSAYRFDQYGQYDKAYQSIFSENADDVFAFFKYEALYSKVEDFQQALARVDEQVVEANKDRVVGYTHLRPPNIINSISI
jgi:hypothetical protein